MKTMKNKPLILGTLLLTLPLMAQAQHEGVGTHGGNAVVCFNNPKIVDALTIPGQLVSKTIPDEYISAITSIETLDLYEAKTGVQGEKARNVIPLLANETEEEYVARIINRFPGWGDAPDNSAFIGSSLWGSERLANGILTGKATLVTINHIQDPSLIPANDIDPISKARPGCVYATMAKQAGIAYSGKRKLVIDDRLFLHPKHSRLSRAVLYLHEYLLADLGAQDGNTDAVRTIVANEIAKEVNFADLSTMLGAYYSESRFTPVALYPLLKKFFAISDPIFVILDDAGYHAKKAFTSKHKDELPSQVIRKAWSDTTEDFWVDVFSCEKVRNAGIKIRVNDKECALLDRLGAQRAEEMNAAKKAAFADYVARQTPGWNEALATAKAGLEKILLSAEQRQALEAQIQALNPFTEKPVLDFKQFEFKPEQIFFKY